MNDEFLKRYSEPPPAEFSSSLRERLLDPRRSDGLTPERINATMNTTPARGWRAALLRWSPVAVAASLVVAAVVFLTWPPAQALAQDFLNLFRVKNFAAVQIDPSRFEALENEQVAIESLMSDSIQVVQEPGKPQLAADAQAAGRQAGFEVRTARGVEGNPRVETYVQGQGVMTFTADVERLQSILDLLNISDVRVPAELDGAKITVTKPPAVVQTYTFPRGRVTLMQSPSPEIELPPGVNLAQLGEIGLRVAGLSPDEARQFAGQIDWNSTLLVPIPANAAEFRNVQVNGVTGLMITSTSNQRNQVPMRRGATLILWAQDGMVFGLEGNTEVLDLLAMANTVR
jgi:hypothetical protein